MKTGLGQISEICSRLTMLQWINLIAAITTIIGVPIALFFSTRTTAEIVLIVYLCIIVTICWVLLIAEEFRYSRKSRYGEAVVDIHNAFHELRDAWYKLQHNSSYQDIELTAHEHINKAIKSYAMAFSLITGVHCRVCIKDVVCYDKNVQPKERGFITLGLYRSDNSSPTLQESSVDYVTDNTDFEEILTDPEKGYFISNDLPTHPGYKNSHWNQEVWARKTFPYVSTMVWAIQKRDVTNKDFFGQDILGFLCIDSLSRNIFWDRYDIDFGAAFADTLYMILKTMKEKKEQINEEEVMADNE